ncbi:50S ribosomal protein L18 [candidate division WOR-3 bacterium]|nr:50S ribosomal protein L18 [candidate division WOR-3 bacterium]
MKGREKRHKRVRRKIFGTSARPRFSVYRSLKHIYAQLIDDTLHHTLVSATSLSIKKGSKIEKSKICGELLAKQALKKNIKNVVFDRGGYKYHGRIRTLADRAREGGLKF